MAFIITCAFGIEKLVKNEIKRMGYRIVDVSDGAIKVDAPMDAVATLNLGLRCAERVFLEVGTFKATTFDMLYDAVNAIDWAAYIAQNDAFPVDAKSHKSKLFSLSDIQKISKKAIVDKLKATYPVTLFKETDAPVGIEIRLNKDIAQVLIDTTGDALHKRGYRQRQGFAPLKETTAAALVLLSNWYGDDVLIDPMCGSGTLLIEAALLKRNIAPGLGRSFAFETFSFVDKQYLKDARQAAYAAIDYDRELCLKGSDINPKMIDMAIENAENAGVDDCIEFNVQDVLDLTIEDDYSKVICNPPYGERLSDSQQVQKLYRALGATIRQNVTLSAFILTSNDAFEDAFGKKADKNRKLYNGKIKCYYYQYHGVKKQRKQE